MLKGDIVVTQTLNIGRGKNVRIDLNGYQLSRGSNLGTMFSVNEGKLTITDSKMAEAVLGRTPSRDSDASDGTGIALPSSLSDGVLTYYESRSAVNADGISTTETRFRNTVNVERMGGIVSGNSSNAALFQVSGSNAVLRIEGGAFSNPQGRIIEASRGAALELTGGYFYGSTAGNGMGGAVYANGYSGLVTVNIGGAWNREAVFVGNSDTNGGALATEGSVAVNIRDGAVFSGNSATGRGRNGQAPACGRRLPGGGAGLRGLQGDGFQNNRRCQWQADNVCDLHQQP